MINLDNDEIIAAWNDYCDAVGFDDDRVYYMNGETDFINEWYAESGMVAAESVIEIAKQLSDYNGEDYFVWQNGNAIWFDDVVGSKSPVMINELQQWLDARHDQEAE